MKKFISLITVTFLLINIFSMNSLIAADEKELVEQAVVNLEEQTEESIEEKTETIVEEITEENIKQEIPEEESLEVTEEAVEENKEESIESELPEVKEEESEETQPVENVEEEKPTESETSEKEEKTTEETQPSENVEEESDEEEVETEETAIVNLNDSEEQLTNNSLTSLTKINLSAGSTPKMDGTCFELTRDTYEYDGKEHIPTLQKIGNEKFDYTYVYLIFGFEGSESEYLAAKNAGKYRLQATITCVPYKMVMGVKVPEVLKTKIFTYDYYFQITKKVIDPESITTKELVYNGKAQYPTICAGDETLIEDVDYEILKKDENSIDAYKDKGEQASYKMEINLLNYTFEGDEKNPEDFEIEYTINKREVQINTSYTNEYDPYGVYPKLVCRSGEKTIDITSSPKKQGTQEERDVYIVGEINNKINENEKYALDAAEEPYSFDLEISKKFALNNIVNGVDLEEKDCVVSNISYTITKVTITPDFDALYYIFETNQIPKFKVLDSKDNNILENHITVVDKDGKPKQVVYDDEDYELSTKYYEVGNYYVFIKMDETLATNYNWDSNHIIAEDSPIAKVGYKINPRRVEFAGWDIEGDSETLTGYFGSYEAEFVWVKEKIGEEEYVSLEYNGFNPFMFVDGDGYYPIPKAKFTYTIDGITCEAKGIYREDCNYDPSMQELFKVKLNVGNYNMYISLDSDHYSAQRTYAGFDVTPKPVTISWSNTTIPFDSDKLEPDCEIIGLAPIDEYGFKLAKKDGGGLEIQTDDKLVVDYSYYVFNENDVPQKVMDAPGNYPITKEGRYAVEAANIVYKKTGTSTKNYVLTGDNLMTSFVVGDVNSEDAENNISVITIDSVDKNIVSSIVLKTISKNEAEQIIAVQSQEVAEALQDAIDHNKNINIYLEASTVTREETVLKDLILPTENAIVIDLKLYACIEGTTERYPLTETGTFKPDIKVTLNQAQATGLGYNSSKCFYIARYHGGRTPDSTQMADPIIAGSGEDTTYTFSLRSNKFSDFAIYVGNKPVKVETNDDHIVPITAA